MSEEEQIQEIERQIAAGGGRAVPPPAWAVENLLKAVNHTIKFLGVERQADETVFMVDLDGVVRRFRIGDSVGFGQGEGENPPRFTVSFRLAE